MIDYCQHAKGYTVNKRSLKPWPLSGDASQCKSVQWSFKLDFNLHFGLAINLWELASTLGASTFKHKTVHVLHRWRSEVRLERTSLKVKIYTDWLNASACITVRPRLSATLLALFYSINILFVLNTCRSQALLFIQKYVLLVSQLWVNRQLT